MDDITMARVYDPGRGAFCAVNKQGRPIFGLPPTKREPLVNRDTNPRGVRHPYKTYEDHIPVAERRRVKEWQVRLKKGHA